MCFTAWAWGVMTWASAPTCPFRCQLLSKYFVHYLHSNSCITTPDASRILYWPYCRLSAAALFIFQVDNYLKSYFFGLKQNFYFAKCFYFRKQLVNCDECVDSQIFHIGKLCNNSILHKWAVAGSVACQLFNQMHLDGQDRLGDCTLHNWSGNYYYELFILEMFVFKLSIVEIRATITSNSCHF